MPLVGQRSAGSFWATRFGGDFCSIGGPGGRIHHGDTLSAPAPCQKATRPPTVPGSAALNREFFGNAGPVTDGASTGTPDALSSA